MSVDYVNVLQEMTIYCDNCDAEDTADGDWQECMDVFKRQGWRVYKDNYGEWAHECPDCVHGPSAEEDFK